MSSTPHHFNRYEIKYVVPRDVANSLRNDLHHYMHRDPHLSDAMPAYRVNSVYFDSDDFKCFWDKVNGVRFRRKVRVRRYGSKMPDQAFLEIKQKIDLTTQKRRNRFPTADLIKRLVDRSGEPLQGEVGEEVELMFHEQKLEPKILVSYDRVAYMGNTDDSLRVTFDSNCRYRQTDLFDEVSTAPDKFFLHPSQQIIEIKFDNLIPRWLVSMLRKRALSPNRISKYCQSVNIAVFKASAF